MKPLFALMRAAGVSAAGLLLSASSSEAAFVPGLRMTAQSVVSPAQDSSLDPQFSPGNRQTSRAFCRCYPGYPQIRQVCRYPGGRTTVQYVHPRRCQ